MKVGAGSRAVAGQAVRRVQGRRRRQGGCREQGSRQAGRTGPYRAVAVVKVGIGSRVVVRQAVRGRIGPSPSSELVQGVG